MSKKYVITNCPAIYKKLRINENDELYIDEYRCNRNIPFYDCQDCTDCLLKQIVKITKNYNKGCGKHCDINRKENNCGKTCNAYKIRQILELLDIQEVE
jgi:hypothetical protein